MMDLTLKGFAKYTLLPGIAPRIRGLASNGFSHVALFMALVYRAVGLLPVTHPYLNPANFGRYGVRNVIAQAAANLVFDRKHIDQIAIFVLLLVGVVLLLVQMAILGMALMAGVAHAGAGPFPADFVGWFEPQDPTNDLAYIVLDRVFGVPNLFNSCVSQGLPCLQSPVPDGPYPFPYHTAMQDMFALYSTAMLIVATLIMSYLVLTTVVETAQSGTPFGRRFNRVWAPLRIVAALGLLIPMTYGLNSAQYITLYVAKWGSGFATNAWSRFVDNNAYSTLLSEPELMVAMPESPAITQDLMQFYTVLATCVQAYKTMYDRDIDAYVVRSTLQNPPNMLIDDFRSFTYQQMLDWTGGDIVVRFGEVNEDDYPNEKGYVRPICGEITLKALSRGAPSTFSTSSYAATTPIDDLSVSYFDDLIMFFWEDATHPLSPPYDVVWISDWGRNINTLILPLNRDPAAPLPTEEDKQYIMSEYQYYLEDRILTAFNSMNNYPWVEDAKMYGWGGAAIWYNKVAQVNGDIVAAVFNLPQVTLYPEVMEKVMAGRRKEDNNLTGQERFTPHQSDGQSVEIKDPVESLIAQSLHQAFVVWNNTTSGCEDTTYSVSSSLGCGRRPATGNKIVDFITLLFGLEGLWDMRRNEHVHPLAQLASLGRTLIEHTINTMGFAAGSGLLGMVTGGTMFGGMLKSLSGFMFSIGMIGLAAGVVLFYVVPMLPFLYFFFAVTGWVKGIFEAMVGVPLWALAHLRIDGNGLPGRAAMNGYYLLLEIFIRPILIVFGLIAAILFFYALVRTLHNTFDLVVSNLTGFNFTAESAMGIPPDETGSIRYYRGAIDQFFFTIIYAVIVYMIGMSCFKLIDLIPQSILRWIGANVESFGDQLKPPAENLVRNTLLGVNALSPGGGFVGQLMGRGRGTAPPPTQL